MKLGVKQALRHAARVHHHHRHRRHRHGPRGHAARRWPAARPSPTRSSSPCAATATTRWSASPAATSRCPGMMMAMVRLNVPSVFIYGGSILPGPAAQRPRRRRVQDVFEAVGQHAGRQAERRRARRSSSGVACPSAGACGGQFTANTMACVSEAIGLALLDSSGAPAPYESRDQYADAPAAIAVMRAAGEAASAPRDIVTPQEPGERRPRRRLHRRLDQRRPAPAGDRARGGHRVRPARRLRHLPRHALLRRPEAGRPLRRRRISARPAACRCVMKELLRRRLLHGDCITVTRPDHRREPRRRSAARPTAR